MSNIPHFIYARRSLHGHQFLMDLIDNDALSDPMTGETAFKDVEVLSERLRLTKEDLDQVAINSCEAAAKAKKARILEREIVEVPLMGYASHVIMKSDEEIAKFDPVKIRTAAPAYTAAATPAKILTKSHVSKDGDGAQGILICSESYAEEIEMQPRARLVAFEESSVHPSIFPFAGIEALEKVLKKAKMKVDNIDYFEIDESVAVTPLLASRVAGIDISKINMHGGCIGLANPLG